MSVLVTPGNLRSALAVARSLGRREIPVTVADARDRSLAGSSRYCRASIRVPSPTKNGDAFVAGILEDAYKADYRVVIPTDDVTVAMLAAARSRFEGLIALPFPDREVIQLVHDKEKLVSLAEEKGIPVPRTVVVRESADLIKATKRIGFPAVVKPRLSRVQCEGKWLEGGGTHYVHTREELENACRAVHRVVSFPLVQEYIPGEGRGLFVLMNHGKPRAAFAHRRIREKPPSGGVSVLSESVAVDPQVLQYSQQLLENLKWHGVAMLEFKLDARDGTVRLLEINGRFWGSLQLAVDAGVDFPYLLYRLAVDGDVEPVFSYREGIRLRWGLGNLDWLFLRLRDCRDVEERLRAVVDFVGPSGRPARAEVFRWDDPLPAFEELSQYVGHILRGAAGRLCLVKNHE